MKKKDMQIQDLFDTSHTIAKLLFERNTYPWEILPKIGEYITSLGELLPEDEYNRMGKSIWIHKSVKMPPTACLADNVIICKGAQIVSVAASLIPFLEHEDRERPDAACWNPSAHGSRHRAPRTESEKQQRIRSVPEPRPCTERVRDASKRIRPYHGS